MTTAFTWLVVLIAIALAFWAIVRDNDRRRHRTAADWERDFPAGQGKLTQFLQAGALGLEAILMDEKREAIAYKKDEEQGMTKTGTKGDDRDRTTVENHGQR
ncbi:MAG TPA: hypothetical protein VNS63_09780 [Blastocatellia bacterium]|nr:hypothetical protein [Blastocatellia bacterium]